MDHPLDHLVLHVRDLARSTAFYSAVLGPLGFVAGRRAGTFVRGGLVIDLRAARIDGPAHQRGAPGLDHIGFGAPSRAAVDALAGSLRAAGIVDHRVNVFDDGTYALFVTDPDGQRVEVTHYPPGVSVVD